MVASLENKALNKATRKQGLGSSKRVLYQCRLARSVEEVLSWHHHKYHAVVSNTLDPLPASGTCRPPLLVLAYMTSFSHVVGLQWMHELHQQTCCVKYTWSPTSQWYLQASPAGACLHDKLQSCGGSTMNACLQIMNAWTSSTIELTEFFRTANKKVELMVLAKMSFLQCIGCRISD